MVFKEFSSVIDLRNPKHTRRGVVFFITLKYPDVTLESSKVVGLVLEPHYEDSNIHGSQYGDEAPKKGLECPEESLRMS